MRGNPRLLGNEAYPRLVRVAPGFESAEPTHRRQAQFFSLMALSLGLAYLVWLGRLVLASRGSPDIFFFFAESLSYLLLCLLSYSTWHHQNCRPENPTVKASFSVDLFVPWGGLPIIPWRSMSWTMAARKRWPP